MIDVTFHDCKYSDDNLEYNLKSSSRSVKSIKKGAFKKISGPLYICQKLN